MPDEKHRQDREMPISETTHTLCIFTGYRFGAEV